MNIANNGSNYEHTKQASMFKISTKNKYVQIIYMLSKGSCNACNWKSKCICLPLIGFFFSQNRPKTLESATPLPILKVRRSWGEMQSLACQKKAHTIKVNTNIFYFKINP